MARIQIISQLGVAVTLLLFLSSFSQASVEIKLAPYDMERSGKLLVKDNMNVVRSSGISSDAVKEMLKEYRSLNASDQLRQQERKIQQQQREISDLQREVRELKQWMGDLKSKIR